MSTTIHPPEDEFWTVPSFIPPPDWVAGTRVHTNHLARVLEERHVQAARMRAAAALENWTGKELGLNCESTRTDFRYYRNIPRPWWSLMLDNVRSFFWR